MIKKFIEMIEGKASEVLCSDFQDANLCDECCHECPWQCEETMEKFIKELKEKSE